jgi:secreted PhoX family phosphatase
MMSSKDKQGSRRSKENSELKNPGRRQVLGVAAMAAAFTAGQGGSAEGQGKKAPRLKHGGPVDPGTKDKRPGRAGYNPVSKFHDLSAQKVYRNGRDYRVQLSKYAKALRQKMGLDREFMHVIRLELKPGSDCTPAEGCCGCCCC